MSEIIIPIITALGGSGLIIGLIKSGLIKIQIGKNGNGGMKGIEEKLNLISENHLEHIESKLEKLIEISQEVLFIVRDIKK